MPNDIKHPVFRLYMDENGHQTLKGDLSKNDNRFLCITGIIMPIAEHNVLTRRMNSLKLSVFGTTDVILHRREIISANKHPFCILENPQRRDLFNDMFIAIVRDIKYRVISVVIDKKMLVDQYSIRAQDPYALALEYLMQRYQNWMQTIKRDNVYGDILAEARGGGEDKITKNTYQEIYMGNGYNQLKNAPMYYSSKEIKLKKKAENIAGLQFVDLVSHAARRHILSTYHRADNFKKSSYEEQIVQILVDNKFRRNRGKIEGYGTVIFP